MTRALQAVHPVLMARDVEESVRFYQRLGFGLALQDAIREPRYAVVLRDGVELHLQWQDASQWEPARDRPAYRFLVRDVDALFVELRDRGALPEAAADGGPWRQPGDTPWGTREFHLRDPAGNLLQFYAPLPAE